jgi:hypothetical protein
METVILDDVKKGVVPAGGDGPFGDDKPLLEGK